MSPTRRSGATVLALAVIACGTAGCSSAALLLACTIPREHPRWHVWLAGDGLEVTAARAEVDPALRLAEGIELPLPTGYSVRRDAYALRVSTPLGPRPVVSLEARGPGGAHLRLRGREVIRYTTAAPGVYSVQLDLPADPAPRSGRLEVSVLDGAGVALGSERLDWRVARYGAVRDTDCL